MSRPWLSVVMPTYNGSTFLPAALDSIAVQADDDMEVIAVDDGSSDGTLDILRHYQRCLRLQIVSRPHSGNWVANTNVGMSSCRGQWIGFFHQDDVWLPGRVARLRAGVRRYSDAVMILHPSWFIDGRARRVGQWRCPLAAGVHAPPEMMERLLVQNFIALPAPIFQRDAAVQAGQLDEELWYAADWDWWLRIASVGKTAYIARKLAGFRIHHHSQTVERSGQSQNLRQQLETVFARHAERMVVPQQVRDVARFAIDVNVQLAASMNGQSGQWQRLATAFVRLGPLGWHSFFRDSRITERVGARLRARLWQ